MIKIGVCGFGTVGQSFVNHVLAYKEKIIKNCGRDICISIIADIIFSSIYLSFIIITNFMTVVNVIITFYYY